MSGAKEEKKDERDETKRGTNRGHPVYEPRSRTMPFLRFEHELAPTICKLISYVGEEDLLRLYEEEYFAKKPNKAEPSYEGFCRRCLNFVVRDENFDPVVPFYIWDAFNEIERVSGGLAFKDFFLDLYIKKHRDYRDREIVDFTGAPHTTEWKQKTEKWVCEHCTIPQEQIAEEMKENAKNHKAKRKYIYMR